MKGIIIGGVKATATATSSNAMAEMKNPEPHKYYKKKGLR